MVPAAPIPKTFLTLSREKILDAIRRNKPSGHELPDIPDFDTPVKDLKKAFTLVAEASGTTVLDAKGGDLPAFLEDRFPDARLIYSTIEDMPSRLTESDGGASPQSLESLDLAVMPGQVGVAENGAVWLSEKELGQRVSAFITQHLVLLLDPKDLVWNMHEAYNRIQIDQTGYGVFVAGPSKTADIEQSLVIGAQGARSLTVIWRS